MTFEYNNQKYKLILFTIAGSRFYGTHYEKGEHPFKPDYVSDTDFRGVFVAEPDTKLGLTGKITEIEIKKDKDGIVPEAQRKLIKELNKKLGLDMPMDEDITLYEIKKFISLALDANPNIMDLIYADDEAIVYKNKKGKKLLKNRDIFMSTKTKFTFSGYALSQLKRIRGHNKFIKKYPKTGIVIEKLKQAFDVEDIDYNFITDHFGGRVSEFTTGIKQQDANKLGKVESMKWEEFLDLYSDFDEDSLTKDEWEEYRKPQLINYVTAKDLRAKKISMDSNVDSITTFEGHSEFHMITLRDFLLKEASFRTISKTQYNIFTPAKEGFKGGIFARNGDLKKNDPEEVGKFVCQISINENEYKKDLDTLGKLWEWRTNRNEKRSVLEEHFGYDTKHGSHLFRLLIGAKNILTTGEYHPRLSGDNLKLVKDILNGKHTYEWVVEEAEKMEKELEILYQSSTLPKSPNHKKANKLLLDLSRKF